MGAAAPHVAVAAGNAVAGGKPEVIAVILQNGVDGGLVQPVVGDGGEPLAVPQVPAVVLRPHQQRPVGARKQSRDHVAGEAVGRCVVLYSAAVHTGEAGKGGHPQVAACVAIHGAYQVAAQAVGMRKGLHVRVRQSAGLGCPVSEAAPGSNPQGAIGVGQQGADKVVRQPVGRGEGIDSAAAKAVEAVWSSHPQVAVLRCGQRQNHVAQQAVAHCVAADRFGSRKIGQARPSSGGFAVAGRVGFHGCMPGDRIQPAAGRSHPQRPGSVLDHRGGCVGGESFPRAQGAEALIAQNVQAVGLGSGPQVTFVVLHQRQHRRRSERIGDGKALDFSIAPARQATVGANPDATFAVGEECLNTAARQLSADCQPRNDIAPAPDLDAILASRRTFIAPRDGQKLGPAPILKDDRLGDGAAQPMAVLERKPPVHKNAVVPIGIEMLNATGRQAIFRREGGHRPILPPRQALACPNPQRAVFGRQQATHIVPWQRGLRVLVEDLEAVAVKAHQAHLSAQPHKPVFALNQRLHRVLRQPVLHHPRLPPIAGQRRGGLKRPRGQRAQDQHGGQKSYPAQAPHCLVRFFFQGTKHPEPGRARGVLRQRSRPPGKSAHFNSNAPDA